MGRLVVEVEARTAEIDRVMILSRYRTDAFRLFEIQGCPHQKRSEGTQAIKSNVSQSPRQSIAV
jgi:hypothetical protein